MKRTLTYRLNIFAFLLPALILFVGILIAPIIMSTIYSLNDFNAISGADMKYVGFGNYIELFSQQLVNDKGVLYTNTNYMGEALGNSLLLGALSVFIQLPIALIIALKLSKGIRGERTYLSIFFMPVLIFTVIIGRLWMNIYETNGLLNSLLGALGIKEQVFGWITSKITSTKMPFQGGWTGYKETALLAAFVPILWQYVGYHMLLMYAGIKGVPADLLEAAQLDGCTEGQVNRFIIIPYIKPILKVSVIFAVTGSLKSFDLIYTLMKDTRRAELPSTLMYKLTFLHNRYGLGSAIAVVLIILCFAFALLISLAFRDKGEKVS